MKYANDFKTQQLSSLKHVMLKLFETFVKVLNGVCLIEK